MIALNRPLLAYNEDSLPFASPDERLSSLIQTGLALEVANRGDFPLEQYQQYQQLGVQISALQAYAMHEFHPLHRDRAHRQEAIYHVEATLELAAKLQVPRIVTVCGFGQEVADQPFERCLEFFQAFTDRAKALGVRLMIEPLSPRRAAAMTDPGEIARLVQELAEPEVFTMLLDTGHLLDSGFELNEFFTHWQHPIEELQLKGPLSAPPSPQMPVQQWVSQLPSLPAVVCVEHRQPITPTAWAELVTALQKA